MKSITDKPSNYIPGGTILMARKSVDSELWRLRPATWWKVWCYILLHVQYKDFKELKRGQGYFNFQELVRANAFGVDVTYPIVDHFLRFAKQANMLAKQKAIHGTLITVLNYNLYQKIDSYKSELKGEFIGDSPAKSSLNGSDNINNKVIKVIKDNNTKVLQNDPHEPVKQENKDITSLIGYLKDKLNLPILDGSLKENRQYCYLAIKKFGSVDKVRLLIDATAQHQFWSTRITSFKNIYYKGVNIISSGRDNKYSVTNI
jgi:hypothetical protein